MAVKNINNHNLINLLSIIKEKSCKNKLTDSNKLIEIKITNSLTKQTKRWQHKSVSETFIITWTNLLIMVSKATKFKKFIVIQSSRSNKDNMLKLKRVRSQDNIKRKEEIS